MPRLQRNWHLEWGSTLPLLYAFIMDGHTVTVTSYRHLHAPAFLGNCRWTGSAEVANRLHVSVRFRASSYQRIYARDANSGKGVRDIWYYCNSRWQRYHRCYFMCFSTTPKPLCNTETSCILGRHPPIDLCWGVWSDEYTCSLCSLVLASLRNTHPAWTSREAEFRLTSYCTLGKPWLED